MVKAMTYDDALKVAKADYYSGICFAIDELERQGYYCTSYHEEIAQSNEENFDADNIKARNNLYVRLGIVEIMQRAYDEVDR